MMPAIAELQSPKLRFDPDREYFVRVTKQSVYRALGKRITQFRAIRPSGKRKWMLPLQTRKSHERVCSAVLKSTMKIVGSPYRESVGIRATDAIFVPLEDNNSEGGEEGVGRGKAESGRGFSSGEDTMGEKRVTSSGEADSIPIYRITYTVSDI